jgi:integrase/recombinase XerD
MTPPARTLAGCLDDYLTLRRALGCKLIRAERDLRQFLGYLGEREQAVLTVEAAADWVSQSRHGAAAPGLGMEAVRGFAVFLHAHDPAHEVPPPGLFPRRRVRAVPYLFSPAGIAALQAAAGQLRGPLRAETYTILIGLLAVTGLRIGEALALDDGDIDHGEGMLIVRQDKAQSFRLVPLHPTALAALAGYRHRRDQVLPGRAAPAGPGLPHRGPPHLQRRPQGLHRPGLRGRARAQDRAVPPGRPRAEAHFRGEHAGRLVSRWR